MTKQFTTHQKKAIAATSEVKQICEPFLKNTSITKFSHARLYNDMRLVYVSSLPKWLEFYFENDFHTAKTFSQSKEFLKNNYILWETIKYNDVIAQSKQQIDITNGITLVEKHKDYYEIFNFGSNSKSKSLTLWYLNHIDILKRFSQYFKSNTEKLMLELSPNKLAPTEALKLKEYQQILTSFAAEDNSSELLELLKVDSWTINTGHQQIKLAKRELECLAHLAYGKSFKVIANQLDISPRTVESYIYKLKKKLNVYNKQDLINLVTQQGLQNLVKH